MEKNEFYDFILNVEESILLGGLVELLEVFNIFTTYIQSNQFSTLNMLVLFREEIKSKLDTISLMSDIAVIRKAAHILIGNLENRFPLTMDVIAASIIDPSVQHLKAIDDWLLLEGNKKIKHMWKRI